MIAFPRNTVLAATGLALTLAACPSCTLAAPIRSIGTMSVTVPQAQVGAMSVQAHNGSVKVTGEAERTTIDVSAQITCEGDTQEEADRRLAATKLVVERDPQQVLIVKTVFDGGPRSGDGAAISIQLPASAVDNLSVVTSNGAVSVDGIGGSLVVTTTNGALSVHDHKGPAKLTTSNGRVEAGNVGGSLEVQTTNGRISATQVAGAATLRSSNGAISIALNPEQNSPLDVHTTNGALDVTVGPAFSGEVDFATSNGRISIKDSANRITDRSVTKSRGHLVVGKGGQISKLATSNGRIEFEVK